MPILKIRNLHIFIETQQGIDRYPFEISGGQRLWVQIVRALIVDPQCLIADDPVSDPDASMQADVINLFDQTRRDRGISIIFITHDISIVQYLADRVGVLCKGRLVELADKMRSSVIQCTRIPRAFLHLCPAFPSIKACGCCRR